MKTKLVTLVYLIIHVPYVLGLHTITCSSMVCAGQLLVNYYVCKGSPKNIKLPFHTKTYVVKPATQ